MKRITTALLLFTSLGAFAQTQNITKEDIEKEVRPLAEKIKTLYLENGKLKTEIGTLNLMLSNANRSIDSLKIQTHANSNAINKTSQELGSKISTTETNTNQKITAVDKSLSKSTLYWIIAFLATVLLSGLVYFLLGKRIKTDKTDVEEQISKTKKSLEEEGIKLDTKLTEVLETQLKLAEAERNKTSNSSEEADHSLALKVADEIMRLNKNLSNMDVNIKGLKQLSASVKRIEDNFAANGYEMPELLNKPFDSRMKVIVANSIPDETLKNGEEIITRIIKPQVNFKGIMIQAAQVEVSVGQ